MGGLRAAWHRVNLFNGIEPFAAGEVANSRPDFRVGLEISLHVVGIVGLEDGPLPNLCIRPALDAEVIGGIDLVGGVAGRGLPKAGTRT